MGHFHFNQNIKNEKRNKKNKKKQIETKIINKETLKKQQINKKK